MRGSRGRDLTKISSLDLEGLSDNCGRRGSFCAHNYFSRRDDEGLVKTGQKKLVRTNMSLKIIVGAEGRLAPTIISFLFTIRQH